VGASLILLTLALTLSPFDGQREPRSLHRITPSLRMCVVDLVDTCLCVVDLVDTYMCVVDLLTYTYVTCFSFKFNT
jgi:hypothetical protein